MRNTIAVLLLASGLLTMAAQLQNYDQRYVRAACATVHVPGLICVIKEDGHVYSVPDAGVKPDAGITILPRWADETYKSKISYCDRLRAREATLNTANGVYPLYPAERKELKWVMTQLQKKNCSELRLRKDFAP